MIRGEQVQVIGDGAAQGDAHAAALGHAEKIQAEIDNLVALAATGKAPASVLQGIADREAKVAELKATPPAPAPPPGTSA